MSKLENDELIEMQASFFQASLQKLELIEQLFLQLEKLPASTIIDDKKALIRQVFSEVHSIKGSSQAFGVPITNKLCHHFEDVLNKMFKDNGEVDQINFELSLKYIDALVEYFNSIKSNLNDDKFFLEKFKNLIESKVEILVADSILLFVGVPKVIDKQILQAYDKNTTKIFIAENSIKALTILNTEHIDYIFCSLHMGPIDGLSLCLAIRNTFKNNIPKFVLLTSDLLKLDSYPEHLRPHLLLEKNQDLTKNLSVFLKEIKNVEIKKVMKPSIDLSKKRDGVNFVFIDDDQNLLDLYKALFDSPDIINVKGINSENDVMKLLTSSHPDVIFSDINMPGINILDLFSKIKSAQGMAKIPVIFITGDKNQSVCADLLKLGATAIFEKDIVINDFFNELEKCNIHFKK